MTVAYDTSTTVGETTGDKTDWSHTAGASNIKGALVYIVIRASNTPPVGVTYGGVAMTKITEANDTNAETGNTTAWFLTNPGNGTKTIAVDVGAAQVWAGICITCTGAANLTTRVGTPIQANADDPSIVIDNPDAWVNYPSGAIFSGQTDPASTTAGTGFTVLGGVDFTGGGVSDTAQFERYTTGTVTGDPTVAFTTAATDDVAMVAVSMGEVTVNTQSVPATTTHTVVLGKRYLKAIAAAVTLTAALIRRVGKTIAATATLTAAIVRRIGKKVSLTATLTAVLDAVFDAGGTVYNQAVAAATTVGAAIEKWLEEFGAKIVRQVNKPRPVGITFTVSLVRRVGKLIAAAISFTVGLVASFIAGGQTFPQAVAAATTFTVSLVRRVGKPIAATTTLTVALVRRIAKAIAVTVTLTVSLVRRVAKFVAAAATFTAALVRRVGKPIAITATLTAAMTRIKAVTQAIAVATTLTVALIRRVGKPIAVTATLTAAFIRRVGKPIAVTATFTAALVRKTAKSVAAAVTLTAALIRKTAKSVAAAITFTVALVARKVALQAIAVATTLTAALKRSTRKPVAAAISFTVALTRRVGKLIAASITFAAALEAIKTGGEAMFVAWIADDG